MPSLSNNQFRQSPDATMSVSAMVFPFAALARSGIVRVVGRINKEYVLRLQIGMRKTHLVHEAYSEDKLIGNMPHVGNWIRMIVVCFEKVEYGKAEQLKKETHVPVKVEPVEHWDA